MKPIPEFEDDLVKAQFLGKRALKDMERIRAFPFYAVPVVFLLVTVEEGLFLAFPNNADNPRFCALFALFTFFLVFVSFGGGVFLAFLQKRSWRSKGDCDRWFEKLNEKLNETELG